jgi:hypothetical protein
MSTGAHSAQRKAWNEAMRSAAPGALQPRTQKRRSDRRKKQDRRDKARKVQSLGDNKEFLAAAWMDALEDVSPSGPAADDDDSYDELDEGEDKKRKRRGNIKKTSMGVLPKRLKARSLASLLLEEINRDDGVARAWIDTEARVPAAEKQLPARKCCPVSGMEGIYTEPKSGIPYANLKALEQIRERPPPWMTLGGSGAFYEALKSIRDEE